MGFKKRTIDFQSKDPAKQRQEGETQAEWLDRIGAREPTDHLQRRKRIEGEVSFANMREWPLMMTEYELAAMLRMNPRTIANWRRRKLSPAWVKVSQTSPVLYQREDVWAWLLKQKHQGGSKRRDEPIDKVAPEPEKKYAATIPAHLAFRKPNG